MFTTTGTVILFLVIAALLGFAIYRYAGGDSPDQSDSFQLLRTSALPPSGSAAELLGDLETEDRAEKALSDTETAGVEEHQNETDVEAESLEVYFEELEQEFGQLEQLFQRLEVEAGEHVSSSSPSRPAPFDEAFVVEMLSPDDAAASAPQPAIRRIADLQAALRNQAESPDWAQESPDAVSLIEDLADLHGPAFAETVDPDPVEPAAIELDDLKKIRGIGKVFEGVLNERGIFTFGQLAALSLDDIEAISSGLKKFGNRASRDRWIEQAQVLAASKAD